MRLTIFALFKVNFSEFGKGMATDSNYFLFDHRNFIGADLESSPAVLDTQMADFRMARTL